MPLSFDTTVVTVEELLSGRASFRVPPFQRPYSWEEAIASQLFDDLQTSFKETGANAESPEYFLGSIILSQVGNQPYDIIDGQQRLITIAIILAVLRDIISEREKKLALQNHLWIGNVLRGGEGRPRISIRDTEDTIFQEHIIKDEGTLQLPRTSKTDAGARILSVVKKIRNDVGDSREEAVSRLTDFILSQCQFIKITAPSIESGYRLFRSVNSPGQKLSEFDIVRAELIGARSDEPEKAHSLSLAWGQLEENYGSKELARYLTAVAATVVPDGYKFGMIDLVKKIHSDVRFKDEFYQRLERFLRNYNDLRNSSIKIDEDNYAINRVIKCLLSLSDNDWLPLALLWLTQRTTPRDTFRFFRGLDALFIGLGILAYNKTNRAKRLSKIQNAIFESTILSSNSPLFLSAEEKNEVRRIVSSPLRPTMPFVKPLLLRLSAEMTDVKADIYFPKNLTLEHVLPKVPNENSVWRRNFTFDERVDLTDLLGNYALLTEKINKSASNAEWITKKKVIFGVKSNQSFPITSNLSAYENWTPQTIRKRHQELVNLVNQIIFV